ncbi:hypothetical protein MNBD_PLANCTO03-985, partial [hydrothermal vent metagenome]
MPPTLRCIFRSRHWQSGLLLILLVSLVRLVYLLWFCPYTLIEDEAHYWEWSRRLELSYYSKGPGIAWVIRASTDLFGTSEWAVRLPAVLFSALGAFCAAGLARDIAKTREGKLSSPHLTQENGLSSPQQTQEGGLSSPRNAIGLYAAAIYLAMPAFWVLGILITIDGPYLACWAAACWAAWRALTTGSLRAHAALGLALAAGFVFKYTVLLLVPGLLLAAWLAHRARRASAEPSPPTPTKRSLSLPPLGLLLTLATASLGLLPVLLWNAQHEWITIQHLLGHLGVKGGDIPPTPGESWSPLWTLELLGIQVGLAGPAILLAVYAAVCAHRERRTDPATWQGARFLLCCGLPVLIFYILVSFLAEPEGNWPLAAWVSAAPLGALGITGAIPLYRERLAAWRDKGKPGVRPHMHRIMAWRWTIGAGVIVALGFARADLLAKLPVIGPLVPQGRLMFADVRAADAARILDELRAETGLEPVVMAQHYGRTSQLAYYLPGRPTVYCAGASMEGPRKQYDLWPETALSNPETHASLLGRPALLVGGRFEQWVPAFARVVEIGQLEGEHKKGRLIYLGYGYRGFPETGGRAFQPATLQT